MTIATRGQTITGDNVDVQGPAAGPSAELTGGTTAEEMQDENAEPEFPLDKLASLDEKISNIRWVVPVLPDQELECLLKISIELAKNNSDTKSEACQRFFREGLTISFTKILTDDAVSSWKPNIHACINNNCLKLIELCVAKLPHDWFCLLDLLAMVLNPNCKFHAFNSSRQSETAGTSLSLTEEELWARPSSDLRNPRGWLVDMINRFGELGGFQLLLDRFQSGKNLSVSVVFALLRPFGQCYEYLTPHTINKYILPILEMVPGILEKLTDDELKREAKNESKSDIVSAIIKSSKNLASRVPNQEELIRTLEGFRLTMILRQLQISSFNGKMNALNEINKVISSVSYYPNRHHGIEEEEYLTPERMAKWINENRVLEIVLRDSLHQPQYVEKLEKILRFVIKERALSLKDLDAVWAAQAGKHEAIVKNVHDLLAKLAWDFSADQLDHLFECFQNSWTSASKRQRERLLELIRRLAEDDKDGVMAHKVLTLFWNLAHAEDVATEIMDQALAAHVKILDYSCSQERDAQKTIWLDKCVEELKNGEMMWVLPALKQIREICVLYEQSQNGGGGGGGGGGGHGQRSHHMYYRQEVIERLQNQHSLVILVTNSLTNYMDHLRALYREHPELTSETYVPDGRYCHALQVQERLNFLRFLLKDGQLWLCKEQAKQIWQCLAENAVFQSDREACFKWFSKLMGDEPDLDPGINKDFFENNILMLDPLLLTESGIKCFERFFKAVNTKENKLKVKRRTLLTEDPDLIGLDYLWKIVTLCSDEIANKAIELLREVSTTLGPKLIQSQLDFHETFITECYDRLRAHYDTVTVLQKSEFEKDFNNKNQLQTRIKAEAVKLCRVMRVLYEYINECDGAFQGERKILPLYRAYRGKHLTFVVRFSSPSRQVEDVEMFTHTNDTMASLRRHILRRIKPGVHYKVELFINGEPLDPADDRKLLSQMPIRDKMLISAKVMQVNSNMASSQESSSDSSTSSPQQPQSQHHLQHAQQHCGGGGGGSVGSTHPNQQQFYDGGGGPATGGAATTTTNTSNTSASTNVDAENLLPGVLMSMQHLYAHFFCQLSALGSSLDYAQLRDSGYRLLQLMPCDMETMDRLRCLFAAGGNRSSSRGTTLLAAQQPQTLRAVTMDSMFFSPSPAEVLYNLEVLYVMLMPAIDPLGEKTYDFQYSFMTSGEAHVFLEMLTKNNFMSSADNVTRRLAYLVVLKICKLILTSVAHVLVRLSEDHTPLPDNNDPDNNESMTTPGMHLRLALRSIPGHSDHILRQASLKLSQGLAHLMVSETGNNTGQAQALFSQALNWELPDLNTVLALLRLVWAASSDNLNALNASPEVLHSLADPRKRNVPLELKTNEILLCKEALELLSIALILNPSSLEHLCHDKRWPNFITDLVLLNPSCAVRLAAAEQLMIICTCGAASRLALQLITPLLFSLLDNLVLDNADTSHELFQLLSQLVNVAYITNCHLPNADGLLVKEVSWLRKSRDQNDVLIEGHLSLAKELLHFLSAEQKCQLGSGNTTTTTSTSTSTSDSNNTNTTNNNNTMTTMTTMSGNLIGELLEDFLFPASKLMLQLNKTGQLGEDPAIPICDTPQTQAAAFNLLISLCLNCVPNFKQLVNMLTEMFYMDPETAILEWDYLPAIGPRPFQGFVGLKNAGATCYMNSVLQQLYMVDSIKEGILAAEGAACDLNEDFSGEERMEMDATDCGGSSVGSNSSAGSSLSGPTDDHRQLQQQQQQQNNCTTTTTTANPDDNRKDYNVGILKQVQAIFGHLACSRLQYYVPRGLWRHFKLQGEPVNLREQQDAVEFFMSLIESLDEALKTLGHEQIMSKILGGSYSDQKICKGCPHRYSKEEPFSVISVDIRNHSSLQDSMEQYVKGELLEGADAYFCEKCAKKVVTVKRLCVKKLPPILGIQLKRFEYDFERVCAIKFNDYFEFPRDLDMEPYTVSGLAKIEGEIIDCDQAPPNSVNNDVCTKYRLSGIVVHSGQASGGHYYSYIRHRDPTSTPSSVDQSRWYKFDDGDVSECRMHDDEEMKVQCFGGDYMGEVFDPMLKRTTYRRQKRWWNAYMLFYTRLDVEEQAENNRRTKEGVTHKRCEEEEQVEKEEEVEQQHAKKKNNNNCSNSGSVNAITKAMEDLKLVGRKETHHLKMPIPIENSIRKQNIKFLHHRSQFSLEYFVFIRKLATSCAQTQQQQQQQQQTNALSTTTSTTTTTTTDSMIEQQTLLSVQLVSNFLFHTGWHTKKNLRGPAMDWCDVLCMHLRYSPAIRSWFAHNMLFNHMHRFCEYLLSCPSNEVRSAFMKILVLLAHFSINDSPCPCPQPLLASNNTIQAAAAADPDASLSDHVLWALLGLLQREVSEHGRHLPHYCNVFHMYANQGLQEKAQLLKMNVPTTFMLVALDEGPGPAIKYQYIELGKLHQVVSTLIRCCDVSAKCASSTGGPVLPNPYADPACHEYIMPIAPQAAEIIYNRSSYIKKVIEDTNLTEDAIKFLQFCSWENPQFSRTVLSELLWQIAFAYCQELRHHIEILLAVLLIEDSWQTHRIHNAIKGVPDEREGLLETIARAKNHYQKRAYQCIKCMVALFSKCQQARVMLNSHADLRRSWASSVAWLQEELERKYPASTQYAYSTWSPPAQSNENSNGYFLERSNSARKTLERAMELMPASSTLTSVDMTTAAAQNQHGGIQQQNRAGSSSGATSGGGAVTAIATDELVVGEEQEMAEPLLVAGDAAQPEPEQQEQTEELLTAGESQQLQQLEQQKQQGLVQTAPPGVVLHHNDASTSTIRNNSEGVSVVGTLGVEGLLTAVAAVSQQRQQQQQQQENNNKMHCAITTTSNNVVGISNKIKSAASSPTSDVVVGGESPPPIIDRLLPDVTRSCDSSSPGDDVPPNTSPALSPPTSSNNNPNSSTNNNNNNNVTNGGKKPPA